MGLDQFSERIPAQFSQPFESYTPGTLVDLTPIVGADTRVDTLWFVNYDSVLHQVAVYLNDGINNVPLWDGNVPRGDGLGNVGTWVEVLSTAFPAGQQFLIVPKGWKLRVSDATAITDAGVRCRAEGGTL